MRYILILSFVLFSSSIFAQGVSNALRFGGWSMHLEDPSINNAPEYNEDNFGVGADIGLTKLGNWHLQLSFSYLKDSFDQNLYAGGITFDRPLNLYLGKWSFAIGASLGIQSRSIAHSRNGEFTELKREVLPMILPYSRASYGNLFMLFSVIPQIERKNNVATGETKYEIKKPVIFWQMGYSF
ncbi:hypothetical protein [Thaumasiovibrio sp. DFM-14]|uniref:hypothetical protein n=1 Tax=Thaumasiovibrio sp. DFM-14 TaxID=3384792 RepID=UPI0039A04A65